MATVERRTIFTSLRQKWAECLLAVIILTASVLCVVWIFRVPLLQNPDESSHIDYVFSIYSAGRLLNVRKPPSAWNVHRRFEGRKDLEGPESTPYDLLSHQYTLYLIDATEFQRIRFRKDEKVPAGYGTGEYYQKLQAGAPQTPAQLPDLQPQDNPWMIQAYPFLYYAAAAFFQRIVSIVASGPVSLFFSARILSVILFACSLVLVYKILRELRLRKIRALLLTAVVAFFPLTIFISASVQPDNLAMLLLLLSSYCALRIRRAGPDARNLTVVLALALGALLVTKYHVFLLTMLAVLGTLVTEYIYRRRSLTFIIRQLVILLVPSLLLFLVQLWIVWGGGQITGGNLHPSKMGLLAGVKSAIRDYYRGGPAWVSWWGVFGWMDAPLVIWSEGFQARLLQLFGVLTLLVLVLVLFRLEQVITRLFVLARRGRWRLALRTAFSNTLIINHFLFSVFMIMLYALTDNTFYAQGRHWFTYTLSGLMITILFAPRALSHRKTQRALSTLLLFGLLVYGGVAIYFSLKTITNRYYVPVTSSALR